MSRVGAADRELAQIERETVTRHGFRAYSRLAWPVVRSDPLITGWHWDAVCDHLEAFYYGAIPNLVIELPPGMSKSSLVCVLFPTWVWTDNPNTRFMYASFDDTLVRQTALDSMTLVDSEWYQNRWDTRIDRSGDVVETTKLYYTTAKGMRFSTTTVKGKATGWHPDIQVVDDPLKPNDAKGVENGAIRDVNNWWSQTMGSRARNAATLRRLVTMQRLHVADLAAFCRERGYYVLSLPMEYSPGRSCFAFSSPEFDEISDCYDDPDLVPLREDPRTEEGELLCEERFSKVAAEETRARLGDSDYETQYNQNAKPKKGGIWEDNYFQRWTVLPNVRKWIQSWDLKFSSEKAGSMVVGQVWAYGSHHETGAIGYYLIDEVRDWWSLRETVKQVRLLTEKWPQTTAKLIENKANGPGVVSILETELDGLILRNPMGSKYERAQAVHYLYEAKNVWVPARNTWKSSSPQGHIDELVAFPKGAYDDRVDATTQALLYLKTGAKQKYVDKLAQLHKMQQQNRRPHGLS